MLTEPTGAKKQAQDRKEADFKPQRLPARHVDAHNRRSDACPIQTTTRISVHAEAPVEAGNRRTYLQYRTFLHPAQRESLQPVLPQFAHSAAVVVFAAGAGLVAAASALLPLPFAPFSFPAELLAAALLPLALGEYEIGSSPLMLRIKFWKFTAPWSRDSMSNSRG